MRTPRLPFSHCLVLYLCQFGLDPKRDRSGNRSQTTARIADRSREIPCKHKADLYQFWINHVLGRSSFPSCKRDLSGVPRKVLLCEKSRMIYDKTDLQTSFLASRYYGVSGVKSFYQVTEVTGFFYKKLGSGHSTKSFLI